MLISIASFPDIFLMLSNSRGNLAIVLDDGVTTFFATAVEGAGSPLLGHFIDGCDLLIASDHFFDDLGIEQVANSGTAEPPTSSRTAMQKGAH